MPTDARNPRSIVVAIPITPADQYLLGLDVDDNGTNPRVFSMVVPAPAAGLASAAPMPAAIYHYFAA